jgi:hypothetical protein
MATVRPATPPAPDRRLLVVLDTGEAVVVSAVVDGSVVERVVTGVVGAGSVLSRVGAGRLEVVVAVLDVALVGVVSTTGRAVWTAEVLGDGAVALPVRVVAAEVGVSGSRVRDAVDGPVEPNGGTVTSGTVRTGTPAPDPTAARPDGPPGGCGGTPPVPGEACPDAPPQAASRRPAMP